MKNWSTNSIKTDLKKRTYWFLNYLLQPIELYWNYDDNFELLKKHPPVFILGPPRSGTTVLYQLMCQHFSFGYINNFVANWYRLPITATRFYKWKNPEKNTIDLKSDYGRSNHSFGPHEFGEFWYRWFTREHFELSKLSKSNILQIQKSIGGMTKFHHNSMVFKNVVNSVRIQQIGSIFPKCVFILIKRDYLDITQSILKARQNLYGNKYHWLSVKIPDYKKIICEPYWIQAVKQVKDVYSLVQSDMSELGVDRFITVDYKELCHDPPQVLTSIYNQFQKKGISVKTDGKFPKSLNYSTGQTVSDGDYDHLKKALMSHE